MAKQGIRATTDKIADAATSGVQNVVEFAGNAAGAAAKAATGAMLTTVKGARRLVSGSKRKAKRTVAAARKVKRSVTKKATTKKPAARKMAAKRRPVRKPTTRRRKTARRAGR